MQIRDISSGQWESFFNDFTQLHHGKHVNMETIENDDPRVRPRLRDVPLLGIVCAYSTSEPSEREESIDVIAHDFPDSQWVFSIDRPSKVQLAEEDGNTVALQIDAFDGSITMIRFEPPKDNMPQGFLVG